MRRGAHTPEELEALFEDAFVLGDPRALASLFEPRALLVAGGVTDEVRGKNRSRSRRRPSGRAPAGARGARLGARPAGRVRRARRGAPLAPKPAAAYGRRNTMEGAERELIAELARDVVMTTAPGELPLFRATSDAFFSAPDSVMRRVGARDEALGFGADAFMALTPFALAVASSVVGFLAQQAKTVAQEAAGEAVRDAMRRWLARVRSGGGRGRRPRSHGRPARARAGGRVREGPGARAVRGAGGPAG